MMIRFFPYWFDHLDDGVYVLALSDHSLNLLFSLHFSYSVLFLGLKEELINTYLF